jgi:hypothetical protein
MEDKYVVLPSMAIVDPSKVVLFLIVNKFQRHHVDKFHATCHVTPTTHYRHRCQPTHYSPYSMDTVVPNVPITVVTRMTTIFISIFVQLLHI